MLIDKVSDALFATGTETIESCSPAGSFMAQLWTGRRATVDVLVDVGAHKSLGFVLAAFGERAYTFAREFRDRLRAVAWLPAEAQEHRSHADLKPRDNISIPHAAVLPH